MASLVIIQKISLSRELKNKLLCNTNCNYNNTTTSRICTVTKIQLAYLRIGYGKAPKKSKSTYNWLKNVDNSDFFSDETYCSSLVYLLLTFVSGIIVASLAPLMTIPIQFDIPACIIL